jgi:hypothetical protein
MQRITKTNITPPYKGPQGPTVQDLFHQNILLDDIDLHIEVSIRINYHAAYAYVAQKNHITFLNPHL